MGKEAAYVHIHPEIDHTPKAPPPQPLSSALQGQSRRIHIHLQMADGRSPLQCDHISSVAIGSIYLRTRYEEPLDSWQEQDLDRLRNKWSDALMNRREYLDSEVRKIVSKKGEDG